MAELLITRKIQELPLLEIVAEKEIRFERGRVAAETDNYILTEFGSILSVRDIMIPTMADYSSLFPSKSLSGSRVAGQQAGAKSTKSFRIEDILDMTENKNIYTGVHNDNDLGCFSDMTSALDGSSLRLDGKRSRGPRKDRTIFSKIQLFRLERRFHDQKYLSSYEKALIAHSLQLTQQQVQTWFQNRRAKAKREEREKKKRLGGSNSDTDDLLHTSSLGCSATSSLISPSPSSSSLPLTISPVFSNTSPILSAEQEKALLSTSSLVSPVMKIINMVNNHIPTLPITPTTTVSIPATPTVPMTTTTSPESPKGPVKSPQTGNQVKFSIDDLTASPKDSK